MNILQIAVVIFALFAISRSYLRWKANNESLREFVLWIIVWSALVVIVFLPHVTQVPANILGIQRGIDVVVYAGIIALFYSTYRIYSKIERIEQDITKLTREMALRKK
jgi:small membrane protein